MKGMAVEFAREKRTNRITVHHRVLWSARTWQVVPVVVFWGVRGTLLPELVVTGSEGKGKG